MEVQTGAPDSGEADKQAGEEGQLVDALEVVHVGDDDAAPFHKVSHLVGR